ncbi:MAG: hypothetical protein JSV96_01625 [Candidatus Aminicenantes bacterium]|nr:MAG: hypothetical protein JSV96_01625 [Candidatus Aminicenantes bacterium]
MEEIESSSWMTLDAIKNAAKVAETVGNLQTGHSMSVFCSIEDDYLELYYSDTASNFIRRYEDKDEFQVALEQRKAEEGETPYEEDQAFEEDYEDEESKNEEEFGDDTEKY